jgi:cytochrome bd-type quinol oxidase subunit 2
VVGVGAVIPLILAYQTFGYWVFRGKFTLEQEASTA